MKRIALLISTLSVLAIASPAKALYNFTASTGGTVDSLGTFVIGSALDDATVSVTVPFDFSIYSTPVASGSTIRVSTNGNIQFTGTGIGIQNNNALPSSSFGNFPVIAAFWDDLDMRSPQVAGGGIYTHTSGVVGSRVFDIEWRGETFGTTGTALTVNFEVRFFEGLNSFQIVYGQTGDASDSAQLNGLGATVGVQAGNTAGSQFTQYSFNQENGITPGLRLTATATPVPFAFSPVTAFAFIGADIARRRAKAKSAKLMQSAESI